MTRSDFHSYRLRLFVSRSATECPSHTPDSRNELFSCDRVLFSIPMYVNIYRERERRGEKKCPQYIFNRIFDIFRPFFETENKTFWKKHFHKNIYILYITRCLNIIYIYIQRDVYLYKRWNYEYNVPQYDIITLIRPK